MELETRDGLLWPCGDRMAYPTIVSELAEIPVILGYCKSTRVCVQAGGNAGLWPRELAGHFEHVYTFEPDRTLFHCLVNNVTAQNVSFFNAAVGFERKLVGMDRRYWPANAGAMTTTLAGAIPTMRIDDLGLANVDLLQLDIEGAELFALEGARETIMRSRPVIVLELRRNARAYGVHDQTIREYVLGLDYVMAERVGYDEIFTPVEHGPKAQNSNPDADPQRHGAS